MADRQTDSPEYIDQVIVVLQDVSDFLGSIQDMIDGTDNDNVTATLKARVDDLLA